MKKEYYVFKMNVTTLNILSLVLIIPLFAIAYFIAPNLLTDYIQLFSSSKDGLITISCIMGYLILHEIVHAIGYIIHGANPKKITFGMEIEKGVFYCLCKQDITRKNCLNAVMYPLFWIGIVTYITSIIFKIPLLLILSIINISGSAGDIMYFIFISKLDKNIMFSELDDGTSFAILSEKDISGVKPFGIKYVEKINEIPRNDFKRIRISKLSGIILGLYILFLVLGILI